MRGIIFVAAILFSVVSYSADNKWYFGAGSALSNAMPGTSGTKFNLMFGVRHDVSEKINRIIFFDGNFNSSTMGSTAIMHLGVGFNFLTLDRGARHSPFIHTSLGYGGANRYIDAAPIGSLGLGFELFRQQDISFEVVYRRLMLFTRATTQVSGNPTVDQIRMGINF